MVKFVEIPDDDQARFARELALAGSVEVMSVAGVFKLPEGEFLPVCRAPGVVLPGRAGEADNHYTWSVFFGTEHGDQRYGLATFESEWPDHRIRIHFDLMTSRRTFFWMLQEAGHRFGLTPQPNGSIDQMVTFEVDSDDEALETIKHVARTIEDEIKAKGS